MTLQVIRQPEPKRFLKIFLVITCNPVHDAFRSIKNNQPNQPMKEPKIAIYVSGGIVQGVRSNISDLIDVEIVDEDNDQDTAEDRWDELQEELPYGNA